MPAPASLHPTAPSGTVQVAGYQGGGSILSQALQELTQNLVAQGKDRWNLPLHLECDVTQRGIKASALLDLIESGERQMGYMASSYLSARVPELAVLDLPFSVAVHERARALAALDGEAGALLREAVARQTGMEVLAFWDNGFRHLSNAVRPIQSPADCQDLVIRTLDSAHYRALFDSLGFQAITTDVKDLVQAVASGRVQAQENPLTNFIHFELWRQHPHVSLTGHLFGVLLLLCPRPWLKSLTASQTEALHRAVARATQRQRELAAAEDARALTQFKALGVQVVLPQSIDRAAMCAATTEVATTLRRNLPNPLVEAYLGSA